MSNILVLADHVGGTVCKTTAELLTIARRLGEPVVVYIGDGVESGPAGRWVAAARRR